MPFLFLKQTLLGNYINFSEQNVYFFVQYFKVLVNQYYT